MSENFEEKQGTFVEESEEDVGGGCCGGGDETASTMSKTMSRSKSQNGETEDEDGGGCCGGGEASDEGEQEYLSGTMKSASKREEEAGGSCCCGGAAEDEEELNMDGEEGGGPMPSRQMSIRLPSRQPSYREAASPEKSNFAKPAAEMKAEEEAAETAPAKEETQLVLDEGMYFVYSPSSGGSTSIQFSRKGLKDGICYAKFTSESKIPAFKFRGTGQTPLSDRCMSDKMMFFKGACLYLKSCKQYKTEPCLYNPDFGPTPVELFLLQVEGNTYIITEMEIGEFYDLQKYTYAVASQAESLSKIYELSGMAVSMMEYNNAILEAKAFRIEL